VAVGVFEGVAVGVTLAVADGDGVNVLVAVGVSVGVAVNVWLAVSVIVGVKVGVSLGSTARVGKTCPDGVFCAMINTPAASAIVTMPNRVITRYWFRFMVLHSGLIDSSIR
jgi:hypothetical protein